MCNDPGHRCNPTNTECQQIYIKKKKPYKYLLGSKEIMFSPKTQYTRQMNIQAHQIRKNQQNFNKFKNHTKKNFNKQEVCMRCTRYIQFNATLIEKNL